MASALRSSANSAIAPGSNSGAAGSGGSPVELSSPVLEVAGSVVVGSPVVPPSLVVPPVVTGSPEVVGVVEVAGPVEPLVVAVAPPLLPSLSTCTESPQAGPQHSARTTARGPAWGLDMVSGGKSPLHRRRL